MAVIGSILTIGAVVALGATVDGRYAKVQEVATVSERLERKILQDQIDFIQKQIWDLEDRWTERYLRENGDYHDSREELVAFMSEDARQRLRELEKQLTALQAKLQDLNS
jgi:ABC-type phosphate transport system auxiliary subunit